MCFPDAVQRASGAPLIRDLYGLGAFYDPGSAAHHFVLRRARETTLWEKWWPAGTVL
jgi:hypothetical protein